MTHNKGRILEENLREYLRKAEEAENDSAYNCAVTLYFKAMSVLADLFLLRKEGFIPSSHSQRFRMLRLKHKELYRIMDKDFPLYQKSYSLRMTKEHAKVLKDDFRKAKDNAGIKIRGKEVLQKEH
ncbi:MAG: hypothetical protein ABIB71_07020 [Candidatus Woesearchaeota archaeon]